MVSLSKKQLACSVLLLAGCQSDLGRINTQSHTDDLVDLYISQAATSIASMQTQLYPSPAKPVTQNRVSTISSATGVVSNMQATGTAGALTFVAHNGSNQSVSNAIKDIIPDNWHYTLSPGISSKKKVSWVGNDQWPHVLDRLGQTYGWYVSIDWNVRSVSVSDVPFVVPVSQKPSTLQPRITPFITGIFKPAIQLSLIHI